MYDCGCALRFISDSSQTAVKAAATKTKKAPSKTAAKADAKKTTKAAAKPSSRRGMLSTSLAIDHS